MPDTTGLDQLYDIIRDPVSGLRNRLNAAIAASRVERLAMPGEAVPEAVLFLREIVGTEHQGSRFRVEYRREAATALTYYERRVKKAELQYGVPDQDERRANWRKLINGGLRLHLAEHGHWPSRKDVLLAADDKIDAATLPEPELVLSALLTSGSDHHARRRQKAIDERTLAVWSGTEAERKALLRPLAKIVHERLSQFGMADQLQHACDMG